jgi:glutathione S-transferase
MADITLHVLKPSVNNLTARIFVRAAGLDCEEIDVWGSTGSDEFLEMNPSGLTPTMEEAGLPRGAMWESCAIMQYLCNKHGLDDLYPTEPAARATIDSAMFYLIGTLYPLIAKATYGALGFPHYPGEVGASDASDEAKSAAQKQSTDALAKPLEVYRKFFLDGKRFIGGDSPSIADIRLAASIEFLRMIDYPFPAWLEDYMSAMETTLGAAYTEPVADVRGFLDYVRSQAA